MKKLYFAAITACMAIMAVSCEKNSDGEANTIFGTWILDTYTIEAQTTVVGSGGENKVVVDYSDRNCVLIFDESYIATGQMGWDISMSQFTYTPEKNEVTFSNKISVGDDGKAMVLIGKYQILQLDGTTLVLKQPDVTIDVGSVFSGKQTATFAFHRKVQ